ncbi:hypothetical protein, partial [Pseudomonas syringae group genomosp. 3]|uniref:hypothetical protein n=1 Tax=Pseudomonas syringae group genomosp. 3 TaxID=251701 RepID=UPI001C818A75
CRQDTVGGQGYHNRVTCQYSLLKVVGIFVFFIWKDYTVSISVVPTGDVFLMRRQRLSVTKR